MSGNKILEVKNLKTSFFTMEGEVPAVDGISFDLHAGETLAIVGESGCGKSVSSLSILRLVESPGKIVSGEILYKGEDLLQKTEREMRKIRGNDISMIFQEPMTSLNPLFTVGRQISESLCIHQQISKDEARRKAIDILRETGIPAPDKCVDYFPHQLSGGMRQRAMIAMALSCNPQILIADEPTTALDVTIQAQILRLLKDIQTRTQTAILLITHDLGIVAQVAQNVMVMYAGQVVEYGSVQAIFKSPAHPYTYGLLRSIPKLNEDAEVLYNIKGSVPSPRNYPEGCRFRPRCEYVTAACESVMSGMCEVEPGHYARCVRGGVYER